MISTHVFLFCLFTCRETNGQISWLNLGTARPDSKSVVNEEKGGRLRIDIDKEERWQTEESKIVKRMKKYAMVGR